jgi:hypothetical protein
MRGSFNAAEMQGCPLINRFKVDICIVCSGKNASKIKKAPFHHRFVQQA